MGASSFYEYREKEACAVEIYSSEMIMSLKIYQRLEYNLVLQRNDAEAIKRKLLVGVQEMVWELHYMDYNSRHYLKYCSRTVQYV